MDADVDSAWICTQAVVSTDSQSGNEKEKNSNYGYIVLNDMIDNGRYKLKEGDNTIGRHPLNHIYIEHPSVSMNHAVIQCDSDGVVLLDKGSLNKTKLNKKILRKDVAYFLEENALLMFGEVQADYFMNEESNEFTNDSKSMAPNDTSIHKATQNDGLSLSKLSNAVIIPKSSRTDIPNAITDCNVSLIIENSSTCKNKKEVSKTITETECTMNTPNDIYTKSNSSSPSDEYLLEALSQVETKQNNLNSNEIFHNLSNGNTLIMNLTESMSEITREDTPSPLMDLKSSILTTNNVIQNQLLSPNQINTEAIREDTPSPILDFGCYNDFENNLETSTHGMISSAIRFPNEVDKFNNTQVLEIDNNIVELNTQTSKNDDILFCEAQKVESGEQSIIPIKNSLDNHSHDNLSGSNNIKLSTNSHNTNKHKIIVNTFEADDDDVFRYFIEKEGKSQPHDLAILENQDFFNCPTQKESIKKNIEQKLTISIHEKETQNLVDLSKSIKNNASVSKNFNEDFTQIPEVDDDFFNCPTQKVSITKKIDSKPKVSSLINDEETQEILEFSNPRKSNSIISKSNSISMHEENTQIPKIDDDFFNCPTQKISTSKNIFPNTKVSTSIHEEETQRPVEFTQLNKTNTISSKTYSTNINKDLIEDLNIDEDFFNCPTQKLSITKKIDPKPKASSSINDEEIQEILEFSNPCKSNQIVSKSYSISMHEENTQIPKIDDDFFNCPTQKISTSKNIFPNTKVSTSIHEEETQRPVEFTQPNKTNTISSKTYSTNINKDLIEDLNIDEDFFNCPTQKLSITKKIDPKTKASSSINDEETQEILEFSNPCKSNSISMHEENTQILKIDDDFFNCPTQKLSITEKIDPKPKVYSINDEETQELLEFSKPCKSNSILSKSCSTSIHEENTHNFKIDDDFFNCPTQKLSITKKMDPTPKVSPSIHEEETQRPLEFTQLNNTNTISSKTHFTNIHKNLTEVPNIDKDFFNCPTQKLSITKKMDPKPKVSSSINDEETQEILEFLNPCKSNQIVSKSYSISIHEEINQNSKIDDDFFNCPTQKLSITKKMDPKPIVYSINDEETQELLEFSKPCKSNSILSKSCSTSIHEENTQIPKIDDDFFNCPTQKLSITKKMDPTPKVSPSIHEEETQRPLEFTQLNKTNTISSKTYSTNIHKDLIEDLNIDEDFFNCPTQKLSITKKIDPKPKASSSINDEETLEILEFSNPCKSNSIISKSNSISMHEKNTQIPKIDDDFFNCPTQKISTSKNIFPNTKVSTSIHEEETQRPVEFTQLNKTNTISSKTYSTNIHKDLIEDLNIDEDFFNCPTQKLSITKKIDPKPKASSSINDEETQETPLNLEFSNPCKSNQIVSKIYPISIHEEINQNSKINDDFFNCPTQKLSITKKMDPKLKVSSTVLEEKTKEFLKFHKPIKNIPSSSKSYTIGKYEDSTQIPEIVDDFFNCPTQKISITKKINQLTKVFITKHEGNAQKSPELTQLNTTNTNISYSDSTNNHKDFFDCPTQVVPCKSISKFSMDCKDHESIPIVINKAEIKDSSIQSISTICFPSNIKQNKGNNVNSTSQKVLTKIQSDSISNCSININENVTKNPEHFDGLNSHEQTILSDNKDICKVQKTKFVKFNTISQSNVQLPVMCNENSSNSTRTNIPKIRVRGDLHMSHSGDSSNNSTIILNKPNKNTVYNNINTTVPFNKNFDSPGCSKTTIKKIDLNASSSTKQEHFIDDSDQSQVSISLKYNHHVKQMDESIFSPLNIPDVSANSLSEQHSSPITIENSLNTFKCEPYTSSNNAFEWKSFWNKKKVQSKDKGKNDKQKSTKIAPEVKENKERYQTRAMTRKRKQNGVVESNKKLCNGNNILEPLVENSSEIVVSFSYLKSRHLQEMKQFVEKTGGTVTDEITQCSVLVTDKIRCTMKILSAIARGCPIVNVNWLKHSYTVKMFQGVDDFIIADKDAERKYKFQLKDSLAKAKTKKLLDGYNVLVTPSVKPGPQEMKVIITCAGGNFVLNWTTTQYTKELIVTCDKDRTRWKPAWDNDFAKIIDSDTLVMSIIRQQLII